MRTAGIIQESLVDYVGQKAYVIFTQGCNFRCRYCQNEELAKYFDESYGKDERLELIFDDLKKKKNKLDAVVVTGGEPTVHKDLPEFIEKIRQLGYKIKLDTNGSNPVMITKLLDRKLLDYVAMDLKAPLELEAYKELVEGRISKKTISNLKRTIEILKSSDIQYEIRTTLIKEKHPVEVIRQIFNEVADCKRFCLQQFESNVVFDRTFNNLTAYSLSELEEIIESISPQVDELILR